MEMAPKRGVTVSFCTRATWDWSSVRTLMDMEIAMEMGDTAWTDGLQMSQFS